MTKMGSTMRLWLVCIAAASGGVLFGYENGAMGGVGVMDGFLLDWFPGIYAAEQHADENDEYCTFSSALLGFILILDYLGAMVGAVLAAWLTTRLGRRYVMTLAGGVYALGVLLSALSAHLAMLIVGRMLVGVGYGLANQNCPVYLAEVAPPSLRGALNLLFQLLMSSGFLVGQGMTLALRELHNGWRIVLAISATPAVSLVLLSLLLPDSPRNLLERHGARTNGALGVYDDDEQQCTDGGVGGDSDEFSSEDYREAYGKARQILLSTRPQADYDVGEELDEIQRGLVEQRRLPKGLAAFRVLLARRAYRPQLCITALVPLWQQFTGAFAVMVFTPQVLGVVAPGHDVLQLQLAIGAVVVTGGVLSIPLVDRLGRRVLLIQGGAQMGVSFVALACVLASGANRHPAGAVVGILLLCVFVAGFSWSWGPIGWLLPSEINPPETRSVGVSVANLVALLTSFVIGQSLLLMLCAMRWGFFLFFAAFHAAMTLFVIFLLPETRNLSLEQVQDSLRKHRVWKRFSDATDALELDASSPVS